MPTIVSLRALAEQIRDVELERVSGRLSERERRQLESVTAKILGKLLHLPTIRMKEAAVAADGQVVADVVSHLFGLGEERRRR
jgi:glutamyl-tRNA reductase